MKVKKYRVKMVEDKVPDSSSENRAEVENWRFKITKLYRCSSQYILKLVYR